MKLEIHNSISTLIVRSIKKSSEKEKKKSQFVSYLDDQKAHDTSIPSLHQQTDDLDKSPSTKRRLT